VILPESTKYIEEQFVGMSAEDIKKITRDNAAKILQSDQLTASEFGYAAAGVIPGRSRFKGGSDA